MGGARSAVGLVVRSDGYVSEAEAVEDVTTEIGINEEETTEIDTTEEVTTEEPDMTAVSQLQLMLT